jgi:hypothetical protein
LHRDVLTGERPPSMSLAGFWPQTLCVPHGLSVPLLPQWKASLQVIRENTVHLGRKPGPLSSAQNYSPCVQSESQHWGAPGSGLQWELGVDDQVGFPHGQLECGTLQPQPPAAFRPTQYGDLNVHSTNRTGARTRSWEDSHSVSQDTGIAV